MLLQEDGRTAPTVRTVPPSSRSPRVSYLDRIDPIHEMEFRDVVTARFSEASVLEYRLSVTPSGALGHESRAVPAPVAVSPDRLYHPLAIRAVAVLMQFHQSSTQQIAAFTGGGPKGTRAALQSLYAAGLVLRSSNLKWSTGQWDDRAGGGIGEVWQMHPDSSRLADWLSGLSDLEYALLSGGQDLLKGTNGASGSVTILHNLAQAEIVLRALEVCPGVIGGWGEPMTRAAQFVEPHPGMRAGIADGAIVGRDGSIILIETSGANNVDRPKTGDRIAEKALAWAAVCARTELPLKVLFVNISPKTRMNRFNWHVTRGLDRIGEQVVRSSHQQKGRGSIFVANAIDWFPFPLAVSEGFRELEAYSPDTRRWHSLLPEDTPLDASSDAVVNTLAALHMPPWIAN